MPLGLYDGVQATAVPEWYTVDWFRAGFVQQYQLLHELVLEDNRILFVGEIK